MNKRQEYYQKNRERIIEYTKNYRLENPEEYKKRNSISCRKYYEKHQDEIIKRTSDYYFEHRDEIRKKRSIKYFLNKKTKPIEISKGELISFE